MLRCNNITTDTGVLFCSRIQYRRGQIYMIGRHSEEQSAAGDGVETVVNEVIHDAVHGEGRKTVKNIHINKYVCACTRACVLLSVFWEFIFWPKTDLQH